ncbi:MAG: LrgB family protein [Rhodocyclaceae bacterium]|nr:MAG: LrgB family protein [Rhodocyclaceae bacterium]
MSQNVSGIWAYLSASPLLGLTITLLAYQAAYWIFRKAKFHPAANPVLLAVAMLVVLLQWTGTPYKTYFEGAQFVHFLLGPATVALAIPLYGQLRRLHAMALPLAVALLAGSITAIVSALVIGKLLGASTVTLISLAPKSVTTPIAMGIAEQLGGLPSLAALMVLTTGILGAVGGSAVYRLLRIHDPAAKGFAMGLAAHGIGTARAFQESEQMGAFSALAMGFNGLLTAVLLPVLLPLFAAWLK